MKIWNSICGWLKMDFRIRQRGIRCGKGWKQNARLTRILVFCLGGLMPAVYGAENAVILDTENAQPDLEFLEFLGQFETDDGQWIDPGSLLADEFEDLLDAAENSGGSNGSGASNDNDADNNGNNSSNNSNSNSSNNSNQ